MVEEQSYEMVEENGQTIMKKVVKQRIHNRSLYFLTHEEAKKLKDTALTFGTDRANQYYAIISLGINVGLRRKEIANLNIKQVNLKDKYIQLGIDTKTRESRIIPIQDDLKKTLIMLIGTRTDGYVILHKSRKDSKRSYSEVQINNIVAQIGKRADIKPKGGIYNSDGKFLEGMKNINPHLLRHSWAKFCQLAGIEKNITRVMGGWKNNKMLDEIYGTPSMETMLEEGGKKMNW